MSRRATGPVDRAFERITQLTPEQYARLQERLIGWGRRNDPVAVRKTRTRKDTPNADPAA